MNEVQPGKAAQRLVSLDAYRGAIMISLISVGFGFSAFAGHPYLNFLARHTEHVPWSGCVYWDLIQPAFMFMVGVAMPFAYARRVSLGESHGRIVWHAVRRAVNLCLVTAIFCSIQEGYPSFSLVNVLPQIAIGYLLTFFVLHKSYWTQGVTAMVILVVYTIAWILYPGNGPDGPWAMGNVNMGSDFEYWLMGHYNAGYWVSLNAIPSTSQIIAGAMCGRLLAENRPSGETMKILAIAAVVLMAAGWLLSYQIPIIKRILSASFALYSTGWAILFLLLFYWIIEVLNIRGWTFVFVVVGMNSITAYIIFQLFRGWIDSSILVFTRPVIEALGAYGSVLQALLVLSAQWYVLYFFYKHKIFFKV